MNITTHTTWAQIETATRQRLEGAVESAVAHAEAASFFLSQAEQNGHDPAFWRAALDWAEEEEATARRALANWQRSDRRTEREAFAFRRALAERASVFFNAARRKEERRFANVCAIVSKKVPEPKAEAIR